MNKLEAGMILLLFCILSASVVFAITDIALPLPTDSSPTTTNQTIIYYLKSINKSVITNTVVSAPTAAELKDLASKKSSNTKPPSSKTVSNANLKTIHWDGILDSSNSQLTFNEVEFNGGKYRLSLNFIDNWRPLLGYRAIEVKVNGVTQQCQSRWGIVWNLSVDHLVLHPDLDQGEVCLAQVGGTEYALTVNNFNKTDGKYSMDLTSPIIPNSCPETLTGNLGLSSPAC